MEEDIKGQRSRTEDKAADTAPGVSPVATQNSSNVQIRSVYIIHIYKQPKQLSFVCYYCCCCVVYCKGKRAPVSLVSFRSLFPSSLLLLLRCCFCVFRSKYARHTLSLLPNRWRMDMILSLPTCLYNGWAMMVERNILQLITTLNTGAASLRERGKGFCIYRSRRLPESPPKLKVQILDCCALTHLTRAADSSSLILYTNSKLHTLICVCLRRVKSIGFVAKRGGILIGCGKE